MSLLYLKKGGKTLKKEKTKEVIAQKVTRFAIKQAQKTVGRSWPVQYHEVEIPEEVKLWIKRGELEI